MPHSARRIGIGGGGKGTGGGKGRRAGPPKYGGGGGRTGSCVTSACDGRRLGGGGGGGGGDGGGGDGGGLDCSVAPGGAVSRAAGAAAVFGSPPGSVAALGSEAVAGTGVAVPSSSAQYHDPGGQLEEGSAWASGEIRVPKPAKASVSQVRGMGDSRQLRLRPVGEESMTSVATQVPGASLLPFQSVDPCFGAVWNGPAGLPPGISWTSGHNRIVRRSYS